MTSPIQDIRAVLLQFERARCKDLYFRSADWAMFMARPDGGANPLLMIEAAKVQDAAPGSQANVAASAPHLGLFEPRCSVGDTIEAGTVVAAIDVLGSKTEVVSKLEGRVVALVPAANDLVEYGDALLKVAVA